MFLSVGIFHSTRIDKICSEEMQLRKKRIKVTISAKKLHIGKTENSLESVIKVIDRIFFWGLQFVIYKAPSALIPYRP